MHTYVDTHAHLSSLSRPGQGGPPGPGPESILGELFTDGAADGAAFGAIIDVGTEAGDLASRLERFGAWPRVWFSAGIWPSAEAIAHRTDRLARLRAEIEGADTSRLAAIGECGLDRHWNRADNDADLAGEAELFDLQLRLALRHGLPVIVHSREAPEETAQRIAAVPGTRGVIHCFSYTRAEAFRFLDLGLYLSFAGTITYKNSGDLREALRAVPAERLLLETDAPYLAPVPFRGRPAEPGMIVHTYAAAAELRGASVPDLAALVARNAAELFGVAIPP